VASTDETVPLNDLYGLLSMLTTLFTKFFDTFPFLVHQPTELTTSTAISSSCEF